MILALLCASALVVLLNIAALQVWEHSVKARLRSQRAEGVVVGASRTWSETSVSGSSSGGGGYISPYTGGTIAAPDVKISSNVSTWHQFLVRSDDGYERAVTIPSGTDFPTREGNRVAQVILVGNRGQWVLWGIKNRQTGVEYWFNPRDFVDAQAPWLFRKYLTVVLFFLLFVLLMFAGFTYAVPEPGQRSPNNSFGLGILLSFVACGVAAGVSFWPRRRSAKRILSNQRRAIGAL